MEHAQKANAFPPRALALALVCLVPAGVAMWRLYASAFPTWKNWDAPVACGGYAGVYGDVRTQGTVCLGAEPITWADAVEKTGGAGCTVGEADAGKKLAAGGKITVSSSGGGCTIVSGRFSGAETLALGMKIDVNSADARDLEALPAIGPALAERIVEFREKNGPFASAGDLMRVKGVGAGTLRKIDGKVEFGPAR